MAFPKQFYKSQIEFYTLSSKKTLKTLRWLSLLRISVFGTSIFLLYTFFQNKTIAFIIVIIGIIIFLILLSKYSDVKKRHLLYKRIIQINEEEIKIDKGEFLDRDDGLEFQNSKHYFSLDIDLFGKGSFFQFLNRTALVEGKNYLASMLLSNAIDDIENRQNVIKELALKPKWRQQYTAIAKGIELDTKISSITHWLTSYKPFLNKTVYSLAILFSICSLIIISVFGFTDLVAEQFIIYWLLLGLIITGVFIKRINHLSVYTQKSKAIFKQYAELLKQIESTNFTSETLLEKQKVIASENKKASEIFQQFSKHLDALDNRNNIFSAIFGNGLFLTDIRHSFKIEQWITKYHKTVTQWFEVVSFFDAYNSLANFSYNHNNYNYPSIHYSENNAVIDAIGLGHPLISNEKRVNSNVLINNKNFLIVTGANMAGKSTFLRTIALHIIMANSGLPVCAKSSKYKPVKLITSMRTSDSLTDDSSYFFSELTRLKFIVDTITPNEKYFIILDEILKGTNSKDKAEGSKKFVEKLVKLNATGIIATHDLSLTILEKETEVIKNYFFDAKIENDLLHFDYKLKKGICENMNANFLLQKMEII